MPRATALQDLPMIGKIVKAKAAAKKPAAAKAAKQQQRATQQAPYDEPPLFTAITDTKPAVKKALDAWVKAYDSNKTKGIVTLISVFIRCCGCKQLVEASQLQNVTETVSRISSEFEESDYPMANNKSGGFAGKLAVFVDMLVQACSKRIIYESDFLSTLIAYLHELSQSPIRSFRHTSTFAAVKLGTSLIAVASDLHEEIDKLEVREVMAIVLKA